MKLLARLRRAIGTEGGIRIFSIDRLNRHHLSVETADAKGSLLSLCSYLVLDACCGVVRAYRARILSKFPDCDDARQGRACHENQVDGACRML